MSGSPSAARKSGTVWGHGAYVAPDWSADWLHREATCLLNHWAASSGKSYEQLDAETQAALRERLKKEIRSNTYNARTCDLIVSPVRADAIQAVSAHYESLFGTDPKLQAFRKAYAIPANTVKTAERQRLMNAFFFWAAWSCGTDRPGSDITYTHNWPAESLIGNGPTTSIVLWSVVSVIVLLAGIGAMVWYNARQKHLHPEDDLEVPERDPLLGLKVTPSMFATLKYFWIVVALIVAQVGLGAITAHYGVEGDGFFGIPLAKWVPYSVARVWHTQLGIFWIATAWLATGLFVAPAVGGRESLGQRFGVNLLFVCLLIIVAGSMVGEWLGCPTKTRLCGEFLVWRTRVCLRGSRTILADISSSSDCLCGCSSWPVLCRRRLKTRTEPPFAGVVRGGVRRHRFILWRRLNVGAANAPCDGRVLAVVGDSSLGGGILRGFCHGCHCLFVHADGIAPHFNRRGRSYLFHRDLPGRRDSRDHAPLVFQRNADGSAGCGRGLQCFGDCAADSGWI